MGGWFWEFTVGRYFFKLGPARIRQHRIKHRAHRFNMYLHHLGTIGQSTDRNPAQSH